MLEDGTKENVTLPMSFDEQCLGERAVGGRSAGDAIGWDCGEHLSGDRKPIQEF